MARASSAVGFGGSRKGSVSVRVIPLNDHVRSLEDKLNLYQDLVLHLEQNERLLISALDKLSGSPVAMNLLYGGECARSRPCHPDF